MSTFIIFIFSFFFFIFCSFARCTYHFHIFHKLQFLNYPVSCPIFFLFSKCSNYIFLFISQLSTSYVLCSSFFSSSFWSISFAFHLVFVTNPDHVFPKTKSSWTLSHLVNGKNFYNFVFIRFLSFFSALHLLFMHLSIDSTFHFGFRFVDFFFWWNIGHKECQKLKMNRMKKKRNKNWSFSQL